MAKGVEGKEEEPEMAKIEEEPKIVGEIEKIEEKPKEEMKRVVRMSDLGGQPKADRIGGKGDFGYMGILPETLTNGKFCFFKGKGFMFRKVGKWSKKFNLKICHWRTMDSIWTTSDLRTKM